MSKPEGADRLVERQGQRLGAARGAPRGRLRCCRRAHHGHRDVRPRQHARRARGVAAARNIEAVGLPPTIVPIPYPCPNEIYEARMAAALADAKARGRHACDLRRSVSRGRARLSRAEARRHRHRAAVSALGAPDRGTGARDDRRRRGDVSGLRRSQAIAEVVRRPPLRPRRCLPNFRPAPIRAARTANFTRA